MITVKQTKKNFKINLLIFFIFLIYFIIGVNIYKDYGISFDENINRDNGFVSLKYIFEKIGINADLSKFVVDIPNLSDYKDKAYGVVFDLPLAFFEFLFDIDNTRDAFLFRHLINFILFFISTVVFFILCNLRSSGAKVCIEKKGSSPGSVLIDRVVMEGSRACLPARRTTEKELVNYKELTNNMVRNINLAVIIPYAIYGGGEVYLKNLNQKS